MASTQVAVRIPDDLLETLDWLVERRSYHSRGEALRAALADVVKLERDREIDEQIRRAYERQPMTDAERMTPFLSSWDRLDDEDWSDW